MVTILAKGPTKSGAANDIRKNTGKGGNYRPTKSGAMTAKG